MFKFINENFIDSHVIINVITFTGLASIFISIFFFTYASTIEQEIVIDQAKIVVNDLMQTVNPLLTSDQKENIKKNLKVPDNSEEDLESLNKNNALMSEAYISLLIIFAVTMVLSVTLSIIYKHNYYRILALNLLLLVFIALTEFTFLHFIPKNYIIADTNWIRWKILTDIKSKIIFSNGTLTTDIPPSVKTQNEAILQAINNNLGNYAPIHANSLNNLSGYMPIQNVSSLNNLNKLI